MKGLAGAVLVLCFTLFIGCGGGGGGGDARNDIEAAIYDIVGNWQVSFSSPNITSGSCAINEPAKTENVTITKSGPMITIAVESGDSFNAYADGDTYTTAAAYQVDIEGETVQINDTSVFTQTGEEVFTGTQTVEGIWPDGLRCTFNYDMYAIKQDNTNQNNSDADESEAIFDATGKWTVIYSDYSIISGTCAKTAFSETHEWEIVQSGNSFTLAVDDMPAETGTVNGFYYFLLSTGREETREGNEAIWQTRVNFRLLSATGFTGMSTQKTIAPSGDICLMEYVLTGTKP